MKLPAWLRHPFIGRFEPTRRPTFSVDEQLIQRVREAEEKLPAGGVVPIRGVDAVRWEKRRRELREAVRVGDTVTAKRLTKELTSQ